jgi:bacteriophage CI repressor helix-turn-helix domain|nr:MAG TPA: LexA-like protein [Caudoviricetes sp.]
MEKKDRLLRLIEHYSDGNKSEFARMIGVSPQAINTWISRNTFDIDIVYAKCINISPEWLLTGNGPMLKTSSDNKTNVEQQQVSTNKADESTPLVTYDPNVGVPYYDVDFVTGFDLIINDQTFLPTANIVVYGFEKAQMWCNATGNSMYPKICHGDMIALRECTLEDVQYGEIYAVVLDTIRTIKILRKSDDPNKFRFIPINTEEYDEQEFCKSRILRVFEVLGNVSRFM